MLERGRRAWRLLDGQSSLFGLKTPSLSIIGTNVLGDSTSSDWSWSITFLGAIILNDPMA